MTDNRTYANGPAVGRKMEYPDRITLPLAKGVKDRLDAVAKDEETRLDVIRKAIAAELARREKKP